MHEHLPVETRIKGDFGVSYTGRMEIISPYLPMTHENQWECVNFVRNS